MMLALVRLLLRLELRRAERMVGGSYSSVASRRLDALRIALEALGDRC